jgi:hypothetical protein
MQAYKLRKECSKNIKRIIFGFPWMSCKSNNDKRMERISRPIIKIYIAQGGLSTTDVKCLNNNISLDNSLDLIDLSTQLK